jgi:hypothetical protein
MIKTCKKCGFPFIAKLSSETCHKGKCPHKKKVIPLKPKRERLHVPAKEYPCLTDKEKEINEYDKISRQYQHMYGITYDTYQTMFAEQGGKCAICGKQTNRLLVDHCHTTGKIRGLLCPACNSGLGMFKDNIESLSTAIIYLKNQGLKYSIVLGNTGKIKAKAP